jgi:predicted hotdog family 3-hydroxylacyl-ACP dehydratase
MNFEQINIEELLPQSPPFIMLDALTHFDQVITRTRMKVKADNIFVKNDQFIESGIIENIAQTCAARMGYINKYIYKNSVKIGFIGAIRNLTIERLPKIGETIITQINTIEEVFQMTLVSVIVKIENETISTGEMKISITDKEIVR